MGSPPSAAHTTPWPRPRPSRGLWPEARWSERAAPPSRPCRTGTAAPELKHSDDRPHAPWFASATHGASPYPQPQPSGIPADPFSRSPYHAVPTYRRALMAFRHHVTDLWRRTLRRRSQKDRFTWARRAKLADAWLPRPHLLHPWPSERFAVRHPRWEPSARIGPARIWCSEAKPRLV